MSKFRPVLVVLSLGAILFLADAAIACPTCGEGLMQADPHAQSIAAGFKYSILFMLSMPYICLGTLCSIAYYSIRRAKIQQVAQQAATGDQVAEPPTDI